MRLLLAAVVIFAMIGFVETVVFAVVGITRWLNERANG